ncbi:MAG: Lar family restriction alleviation protein [Oscillospiraceae bacterium]|nr:Lar family restriction alleviation protein [Oscillospiraceae bacterium]
MNELKPCPFCGGQPRFGNFYRNWVVCPDCRMETPYYENTEDAVKMWNKRVVETKHESQTKGE